VSGNVIDRRGQSATNPDCCDVRRRRPESNTQLFVRLITQNFEEAVVARKQGRAPVFHD
jgi:hypothetical protein